MPIEMVKTSVSAALDALNREFDRLNTLHFSGALSRPKIEFSARKSFGGYYQKRAHRIVLSWQAYVEHGWEETVNTFRHEVAHIIHSNHRADFWNLAFQLGVVRKYARDPVQPTLRRVLIYECPNCRKQIQRKRRIANSSCSACDRRYNPKFRFRLLEVQEPESARAFTSTQPGQRDAIE